MCGLAQGNVVSQCWQTLQIPIHNAKETWKSCNSSYSMACDNYNCKHSINVGCTCKCFGCPISFHVQVIIFSLNSEITFSWQNLPLIGLEQNGPQYKTWIVWKQAISKCLNLGWNQCLPWPLGKWLASSNPSGWYYHYATNSLWEAHGSQWQCHGGIPQQTCQHKFYAASQVESPPLLVELEKATIVRHDPQLWMTGCSSCIHQHKALTPVSRWEPLFLWHNGSWNSN